MFRKHYFEVVDRTFTYVLHFCNNGNLIIPFGGKIFGFGGGFRQIISVIPKETRQDVVHAIINSSYLWNFCEVITLHTNMRLLIGNSDIDVVGTRFIHIHWVLMITMYLNNNWVY